MGRRPPRFEREHKVRYACAIWCVVLMSPAAHAQTPEFNWRAVCEICDPQSYCQQSFKDMCAAMAPRHPPSPRIIEPEIFDEYTAHCADDLALRSPLGTGTPRLLPSTNRRFSDELARRYRAGGDESNGRSGGPVGWAATLHFILWLESVRLFQDVDVDHRWLGKRRRELQFRRSRPRVLDRRGCFRTRRG
jgi:hypothetical protein